MKRAARCITPSKLPLLRFPTFPKDKALTFAVDWPMEARMTQSLRIARICIITC